MTRPNDTAARTLAIPGRSLVVLIGPSGSGKSTFARKHFTPFQVIESDHCRALVCDDATDQGATPAAFDLLHYLAGKRLELGKLTVIDATNVEPHARRKLVALGRERHFTVVAIVFDIGEEAALRHNSMRPDRQVAPEVVRRQNADLHLSRKDLSREGFGRIYVLKTPGEISAATVVIG